MKINNILFLSLIITIYTSCTPFLNKQEVDFKTKTLPELIKLGCDLRDDKVFPAICQLLNDSILLKKKSTLMIVPYYVYEVVGENDTIYDFKLRFFCVDHYPPIETTILDIVPRGDTVLINDIPCEKQKFKILVRKSIFNTDKENYAGSTIVRKKIEYFGEIDIPTTIALLNIKVKINRGLSVVEYYSFFNCLQELISIFEEKQNEIAMTMWNQNFDSLRNNKKLAVWELASYRIWLYFDLISA